MTRAPSGKGKRRPSGDDRPRAVDLRSFIKDVPDFPKPGIVFKDITPLLGDAAAFRSAIERMAAPYEGKGLKAVAGVESRGFLLATAIAYRLGCGIIPIRKKGKLPRETYRESYQLEYGTDSLEAHRDALASGDPVALVDDVLATGGTAAASCALIEKLGGKLVGASFLIELGFLKGREKLAGRPAHSLITY